MRQVWLSEGDGGPRLAAMPPMPEDARAQFHVQAKPAGAVSNLDCKHCFFLSKEMPGSRFRKPSKTRHTQRR